MNLIQLNLNPHCPALKYAFLTISPCKVRLHRKKCPGSPLPVVEAQLLLLPLLLPLLLLVMCDADAAAADDDDDGDGDD